MKHLDILDSYNEYNYVYYEHSDELYSEYKKMYEIIESTGHVLMSDSWQVDGGILLRNNDEIIAGAFFNLSKSFSDILIHIIFVREEHRKRGIYKKMHSLIDLIGKKFNRSSVYSYIHIDNEIMQKHVMKKIGYKPILQLVKRDIR